MSEALLVRASVNDLLARRADCVSDQALGAVAGIVADVRDHGETAVWEHAERLKDARAGDPRYYHRPALEAALRTLPTSDRARMERAAGRITGFAQAQRRAIIETGVAFPGGAAGHSLAPIQRAGCYAPGGRHPLPSSVLMTVIPARVAGVTSVWVASPRPAPVTLAAASLAGADGVLAAGGAQAIAALAYGSGPVPASDVVVGPGNRYVTAAKCLVSRHVGIDMLAGPSELVVLADQSADPALVAADLLAQAEHDVDAFPVLVTTDAGVVERVERELRWQIRDLPSAGTARAALMRGGAVVVGTLDEAISVCDELAPEHLALMVRAPGEVAPRLKHYGALFIGAGAGEVLGDYGAGPNHVLPTGGTARVRAGLSVFTFLRLRTWLRCDDSHAARQLLDDAAWFGRLEGLEGHARSAERRIPTA